MKLPRSAYQSADVLHLARFFLGKKLRVRTPAGICGGLITETEAYGGAEDRACHGYNNRRTARTEVLFAAGGQAYVYLCYGLHHMLNFVTGPAGSPQAVLIRGVEVTEGIEAVRRRRQGVPPAAWANGPGKVAQALGVGARHQGCDLTGDRIWVEDDGVIVPDAEVVQSVRVGVDYAGEWALKPWRWMWSRPVQSKLEKVRERRVAVRVGAK